MVRIVALASILNKRNVTVYELGQRNSEWRICWRVFLEEVGFEGFKIHWQVACQILNQAINIADVEKILEGDVGLVVWGILSLFLLFNYVLKSLFEDASLGV